MPRTPSIPPLLLVPALALAVLLAATWLQFGVDWNVPVLLALLASVALGYLLRAPRLSWRQGLAGAAVIVGVFAFVAGVYGGAAACNAAGYPADADYGVSYDLATNELRFGDNVAGSNYRCSTEPYRGVCSLGYLLVVGGLVVDFRSRRDSSLGTRTDAEPSTG